VRLRHEGLACDFRKRPGDADGGDLRMRGEPAVVVAFAVAEAMPGRGEADAGHDDDVGRDGGAFARTDAALVEAARRLAVPLPEFHEPALAPCIRQRQRHIGQTRVGGERLRCVKFRSPRAVQAEALGFEFRDDGAKRRRQGLARGRGGRRRGESVTLVQQALAHGPPDGVLKWDGGVVGRFGHG
jgi:hypothetical protein